MVVTLTCQTCGKEYETTPYKAERTENNYCSQDCYGKSIGEGKRTVECHWCGDELERYASSIKGKTFCDKQCHDEYQREDGPSGQHSKAWKGGKVTTECDYCGVEYEDFPSRIGRTDGTYCSSQCFGKDQRGLRQDVIERARESGKWGRVREDILDRDKRRCQTCGGDKNLHVHHKTPVSEGGAPFDPENLVTVCQTCHFHIHH